MRLDLRQGVSRRRAAPRRACARTCRPLAPPGAAKLPHGPLRLGRLLAFVGLAGPHTPPARCICLCLSRLVVRGLGPDGPLRVRAPTRAHCVRPVPRMGRCVGCTPFGWLCVAVHSWAAERACTTYMGSRRMARTRIGRCGRLNPHGWPGAPASEQARCACQPRMGSLCTPASASPRCACQPPRGPAAPACSARARRVCLRPPGPLRPPEPSRPALRAFARHARPRLSALPGGRCRGDTPPAPPGRPAQTFPKPPRIC
jgi:hypothetical protein